nr:MAG TPA: hypothetical protein [Caudoviricetes sp.]
MQIGRDLICSERTSIEYLALLDNELNKAEDILESRLRLAPDAWRQFRIAKVALSKALEGVYTTMPIKDLKRLLRFADQSAIYIQTKKASEPTEYELVPKDVLNRVVEQACGEGCAYCVKMPLEVAMCDIRKDLMLIAPPEKLDSPYGCPFRSCDTFDDV